MTLHSRVGGSVFGSMTLGLIQHGVGDLNKWSFCQKDGSLNALGPELNRYTAQPLINFPVIYWPLLEIEKKN